MSSSMIAHASPVSACLMVVGKKEVTRRHGSLSVGSCAFEKLVVAFGAGSSECASFSTCIAGADFVIKTIVNEVCQEGRRIQGRWMSSAFQSLHREWWRWRFKAGRSLFSISRLLVLLLLFQQKYILAAQKATRSCQMTSNANLHINVFATAPCTLERKGLRLMQDAMWSLIHYGLHYMECLCSKLLLESTF